MRRQKTGVESKELGDDKRMRGVKKPGRYEKTREVSKDRGVVKRQGM